jgi:Spy/CpxP family protein refolding chaperone
MRKASTIITLITLSVFFSSMFIFGNDEHARSLDAILQEIREKQGLESNAPIDPEGVSYEDLEELGEAIMGIMHPDPKQHELMDEMMGGEGSENLAAMHRMMGYRYLSGSSRGMMGPGMMSGMMGGTSMPMMGPGMMGGMMGSGGWSGSDYYLTLKDTLNLSSSQISRLKEKRLAHTKLTNELQSKLRVANAEVRNLLEDEKINMKEVEKKIREIERYRGDLRLAAIKSQIEARSILTQNQREKLRNMWNQRMMDQGMMGTGMGSQPGGSGMGSMH